LSDWVLFAERAVNMHTAYSVLPPLLFLIAGIELSSRDGVTTEATGGHPIWVISKQELENYPVGPTVGGVQPRGVQWTQSKPCSQDGSSPITTPGLAMITGAVKAD
jgi:hypothetical protein